MKLLEYEAKNLIKQAGITVPTSLIVTKTTVELPVPIVLKSQVLTGGRGKAGGILVIETQDELKPSIEKLFNLSIKGLQPSTLLAEEKLTIKKEYYLSLLIDRQLSAIKLLAHINGGIEVEENHDFKSWTLSYRPDFDSLGQELADYYQLPDQTFALQDLLEKLHDCLIKNDALLIEINPLILTLENKLIAGDCKMTLDDAASFRHEWTYEEQPAEVNFVTIDPNGNTATIANGAGLAMATVDAAYEAGLTPANFLDIGGGANEQTLLKAFERIVTYPNLQVIIVNIFAGITRADEVARAIVAAKDKIPNLPPLFIRLAGTNYDTAKAILSENNIALLSNLDEALKAGREIVDA